MRPFYKRIPSIQSLNLNNVVFPDVETRRAGSEQPWIKMMQQAPKVETVVQALPDQRTLKDALYAVNWTSVRYWTTVILALLLILSATLVPPIIVGTSTESGDIFSQFTCHPDGSVEFPWGDTYYNAWALTSILDINIGFGSMPFALVKFIDVVWDLVIGRGGQALLSVLVYRILSQALLYSMETRHSSFRRFAATSFETGSTSALRVYVQDLFMDRRARGFRSSMLVLASIIATAYLIAFPTILSGISGYQAISTANCTDPINDGNMFDTSTSSLAPILYIIKDGSRIGLADNYAWADVEDYWAPQWYLEEYCMTGSNYSCPKNQTSTFHFNSWHDINLMAPPLDIEVVDYILYFYGNQTVNTTISGVYLEAHTKCYPGPYYQWGFSSLGIFLWLVFTSLFAISLYAIWVSTYMFSRLDRNGRKLGTYRAILDMTSALREEFGDDCDNMSNAQIQEQLKKKDAGIKVDSENLPEPRYNDMRFRKWKGFGKIGRYQALRRERAASQAFAET